MYGGISADLLVNYARRVGIYMQLELEGLHTPEWYFINPEYLTDVVDQLQYYSPCGETHGSHGSVDHPSYTRLRKHLAEKNLIHMELGWRNGDRVNKSFYLNNYLMLPGDKFSCAAAMKYTMQKHGNYNNGKIDPTVKNYRDEE